MKLKKVFPLVMVFCMLMMSVSCAFTDVPSDHWAYTSIQEMVNKNVLSGYEDGTFRPEAPITRAEFATILVKALKIEENDSVMKFKDVEGVHWAESFIDLANTYLTGYRVNGEYYFKPGESALREDAAVAIVKAKELANEDVNLSILNKFSDEDEISENLRKYVAIAVENGLMKGNANGTFCPKGNLTRAEVAALFNNISEYEEEEPEEVEEKIVVDDVVENEEEVPKNIPIQKITLNKTNIELEVGETYAIKVEVYPTNATVNYVTWQSSDNKVVTVNSKGKLIALNPGNAKILVKYVGSTIYGTTCDVTVVEPEKILDDEIEKEDILFGNKVLKIPMDKSIIQNIEIYWLKESGETYKENYKLETLENLGIIVDNKLYTSKFKDLISDEDIIDYDKILVYFTIKISGNNGMAITTLNVEVQEEEDDEKEIVNTKEKVSIDANFFANGNPIGNTANMTNIFSVMIDGEKVVLPCEADVGSDVTVSFEHGVLFYNEKLEKSPYTFTLERDVTINGTIQALPAGKIPNPATGEIITMPGGISGSCKITH